MPVCHYLPLHHYVKALSGWAIRLLNWREESLSSSPGFSYQRYSRQRTWLYSAMWTTSFIQSSMVAARSQTKDCSLSTPNHDDHWYIVGKGKHCVTGSSHTISRNSTCSAQNEQEFPPLDIQSFCPTSSMPPTSHLWPPRVTWNAWHLPLNHNRHGKSFASGANLVCVRVFSWPPHQAVAVSPPTTLSQSCGGFPLA